MRATTTSNITVETLEQRRMLSADIAPLGLNVVPNLATFIINGDFNGDGQGDLLIEQPGGYKLFIHDDPTGRTVALPAFSDDFSLKAAGDLNGDGTDDLIFTNNTTGRAYVWFMRDAKPAYQGYVRAPQAGDAWRFAGCGDFNGDGNDDLVWTNNTAGRQSIWNMAGRFVQSTDMINHAPRDSRFVMEKVYDSNNDGHPDFIWKNSGTFAKYAWYMNGKTVVGGAGVYEIAWNQG